MSTAPQQSDDRPSALSDRYLVTPAEAAALLSVTPRQMRELYAQGQIPHYKVGRLVRLRVADVHRYVALNRASNRGDRSVMAGTTTAHITFSTTDTESVSFDYFEEFCGGRLLAFRTQDESTWSGYRLLVNPSEVTRIEFEGDQ